MIRKAPDEVIARLPEYRKELETRVDKTVRDQAQQGATQLDKQLDEFLPTHKEEVGQLLLNGQDPAKVEQFGNELDKSFTDFMTTQKIGDTTIQEKLDSTLVALKQVSTRTAKLAGNKDLNPSERQARHAVAMLMRRIDAAQAAEPNAIRPIDVEGLKEKANDAVEQVKSTVGDKVQENTTPASPVATPTLKSKAKSTAPPLTPKSMDSAGTSKPTKG